MKHHLRSLVHEAVQSLAAEGLLEPGAVPEVVLERSRGGSHGDFACPLAMALARVLRRKPREIAETLVARLPPSERVERVEVAGPGFINFFLTEGAWQGVAPAVVAAGADYGRNDACGGRRVQVEFVSANPTGPLHVGHGRGAAYGSVVANLLGAVGCDVQREYYINDAGRQMDILAVSVWMRYLQSAGQPREGGAFAFPAAGYRGDYVREMAAALRAAAGDAYLRSAAQIGADLPPDEPEGGDKEAHVDALVARAKALLGADAYRRLHEHAVGSQVADIREDLAEFGVEFDRWYSERSLVDSGAIERAVARLREAGHAFERDGAVWFGSTRFGDEKDRVIVRENGAPTYFASDIAYHMEKFERGFERVIDVWGADHHGYVPRVKGALAALGEDPARFDVLLVQFVQLYRGGEKAQMSTRAGEFVTLRELRREVGNDACRFFYVMRRCEQHLDFDLDLAKSQSSDNPVYYVQYAHARIASVLREAETRGMAFDPRGARAATELLREPHELALLRSLSRYPEVVESAASDLEPHQVAFYLRELANDFHTYYNAHTFLVDDRRLREARLVLVAATKQVLVNGLGLLGVSAPQQM